MQFGQKAFGGALNGRRLAGLAALALIAAVAAGAIFLPTPDARTALRNGDYRAARTALQKAAEAGDSWAQNALGNLNYLGLGAEADYRQAIAWYWQAAVQGNFQAQINLGHIYAQGLGVPLDPVRAFAWYELAARSDARAAEFMRLMAGTSGLPVLLTPNQIQRSRQIYRSIEDLEP